MMVPFESAVRGSLEGSRGGRAHVPTTCRGTITRTALHHYQGRNSIHLREWGALHHAKLKYALNITFQFTFVSGVPCTSTPTVDTPPTMTSFNSPS